jgi:hypothetical protein
MRKDDRNWWIGMVLFIVGVLFLALAGTFTMVNLAYGHEDEYWTHDRVPLSRGWKNCKYWIRMSYLEMHEEPPCQYWFYAHGIVHVSPVLDTCICLEDVEKEIEEIKNEN